MWCQVQATSAISGHGCPLVRSKHAMCSANDGRIYLYGGKSLLNQTLRDLWRFDPDTNHWQQLNTIIRNDEMCKSTNGCSSTSSSSSTTVVSASQMCRSTEWPNKNHQSSCWDAINDFPPPLQEHTILNYQVSLLYIFSTLIAFPILSLIETQKKILFFCFAHILSGQTICIWWRNWIFLR